MIKVMLIIYVYALIIYAIKKDFKEYFMANKKIETKTTKNNLIDLNDLHKTFENVG